MELNQCLFLLSMKYLLALKFFKTFFPRVVIGGDIGLLRVNLPFSDRELSSEIIL
jgi:hypothetical protein